MIDRYVMLQQSLSCCSCPQAARNTPYFNGFRCYRTTRHGAGSELTPGLTNWKENEIDHQIRQIVSSANYTLNNIQILHKIAWFVILALPNPFQNGKVSEKRVKPLSPR